MMGKLRRAVRSAVRKLAAFQIRGAPRLMIYIFVMLILFCIMLFIGGWAFVWYRTAEPPLPVMIQFIAAITSVSFVAAIGFFGRALIDGDDNGIPDTFEKEDDNHEDRHRRI